MGTLTLEKPKNLTYPQWKNATWSEYLAIVENPDLEDVRVFYNEGELWIDMGNEGPLHAKFNILFALIFYLWFAQKQPEQIYDLFGGCVIAKPNQKGVSPDHIVYVGDNIPQWQTGESRRINLDKWRVPDLVAEISDTTLAIDLDEKKQIYADLKIQEYWVINIKGNEVIIFIL
ncbi:MAG TPA: Uma2 family endonuclease, partial [Allocoleopsis sp.]